MRWAFGRCIGMYRACRPYLGKCIGRVSLDVDLRECIE